jgi:alkylation response protein AidB-like acyl-CoA dehydrogenase
MSWPVEYGGQAIEGIYEYILNEALARHAAPQIGKGVGIIGKTLIRHGSAKLKAEFLPKILRAEIEFAVGYSEPQAGSDAANMQLKAEKVEAAGCSTARRCGPPRPTSPTGTGSARAPIRTRRSTTASPCS